MNSKQSSHVATISNSMSIVDGDLIARQNGWASDHLRHKFHIEKVR